MCNIFKTQLHLRLNLETNVAKGDLLQNPELVKRPLMILPQDAGEAGFGATLS